MLIQKSPNFPEEEETINLTPLIDVIFIVLMSFLLIAPILYIESIQLPRSNGIYHQKILQKDSSIDIIIKKDNSIWIDKKKWDLLEAKRYLKQRYQPQKKLRLFQDSSSTFGIHQQIKNIAQETGYEQLDIILEP